MTSAPVKVVVIGSANVDMVAIGKRIPQPGETLFAESFISVPGGKGANQAVAAARLGADVSFVACVGQDSFGDNAIAGYNREDIHTDAIMQHPTAHTGVALINVDAEGRNAILVAPGANEFLSVQMVNECKKLIADADILVLQLEIPVETVKRCCEIANEHQTPVLLNPAPFKQVDMDMLSMASVLTPNEFELMELLHNSVESDDEPTAASELQRLTQSTLVVTLGKRGVLLCEGGALQLLPAYVVQSVDSTGAGDCFSGALAVKLAEGAKLPQAVAFAQAAAAISVTRLGAQASMPTHDEVEAFMQDALSPGLNNTPTIREGKS